MTAVKTLRGETVPGRIDTGVELVTRANLDSPEVQALVRPGE
jgi:ABC-type sugar transport system substrate-binding protein